jgi:hypothetical protein
MIIGFTEYYLTIMLVQYAGNRTGRAADVNNASGTRS